MSDEEVRAVLAWSPWVGLAAAAGVYLDGGRATVFGLEPRGLSMLVLLLGAGWWLATTRVGGGDRAVWLFGSTGAVGLSVLLGYALADAPPSAVGWLSLATGLAIGFAAVASRSLARSELPAASRSLGVFLVFGQALDATTTAVGIDALGYSEQNPTSAAILSVATQLPGADVIGVGWLFVAVKVSLAAAVLAVLHGTTSDRTERAALGLAAYVGLGPAVHNIVLFTGV